LLRIALLSVRLAILVLAILVLAFSVLEFRSWNFGLGISVLALGNKKGPEEAPHTPPVFRRALAIPGGVPGYDDDKEFGNNVSHVVAQLPKGCANIAAKRPMSRDRRRLPRFCHSSRVPDIRREGICDLLPRAETGRDAGIRHTYLYAKRAKGFRSFHERPGMTSESHALAVSGVTHANSGS
jgi:hypothetical protein